ncbi:putative ATP-dependent DNA helicase CHR12 [Artemisia annua]|uniref:Putative ATP-dependent DNA helicase CHR12 n=1 Tax=Artemisia annua TaxID=35608 RepID=A0A2U1NYT3_ARTAN|nr:putative ATP-dependent DNA helicase CHR12 [Artemisia annua]
MFLLTVFTIIIEYCMDSVEGLTDHASVTLHLQWHVSILPWRVLAYIRLTEEDTTSSSRIFIKILFQENNSNNSQKREKNSQKPCYKDQYPESQVSINTAANLQIILKRSIFQRTAKAFLADNPHCILDYNARLWDFEVSNTFLAHGSYSLQIDAPYVALLFGGISHETEHRPFLIPSTCSKESLTKETRAAGEQCPTNCKTIQTVSLIAYLMENKVVTRPHLIVAPKAVLRNWINEFSTWAPSSLVDKKYFHSTKLDPLDNIEEWFNGTMPDAEVIMKRLRSDFLIGSAINNNIIKNLPYQLFFDWTSKSPCCCAPQWKTGPHMVHVRYQGVVYYSEILVIDGFRNRSKGSMVDTIARKYQVDIILAKETQVRLFGKPVLNRIWPSRSCGGSPDPVKRKWTALNLDSSILYDMPIQNSRFTMIGGEGKWPKIDR